MNYDYSRNKLAAVIASHGRTRDETQVAWSKLHVVDGCAFRRESRKQISATAGRSAWDMLSRRTLRTFQWSAQ